MLSHSHYCVEQELQKVMLNEMEQNFTLLMNGFLSELQSVQVPQKYKVFFGDMNSKTRKKNRSLCGTLPQKEFIPRNSLLTDLLEINHIQTIYHIFIAILVILLMATVITDVLETGYVQLDFQLIPWAFGKFETVLMTWVSLNIEFI